jgi:2-methylcitrate dehydratase PrpD
MCAVNAGERLARFVAEAESIPEDALHQAKRSALDTLGVALAGSCEESARAVAGWLREQGGRPEAVVLGRAFRLPAADAALANGTAAHALDFDDVSLPMRGHPSAPLLPAVLATAESVGSSGRDLLTAFVLGFEVQAKLGRAVGASHYALGWHATSTLGTLGAAAGCARLLRLDAGRTWMALGVAASLASGLQQNFGSMTKPLHAGWAARSGVVAAQFAARGFSADAAALDGPAGFLHAMSGGAEPDLTPLDALGGPFEIVSPGVGVKLYPCCYATHRAIDAVLELRSAHGIAVANVAEVRVEVNRGGLLPLRREPPATGLEAKFSLEYCLAAALTDGAVGLPSFTDEAVLRPAMRELMAKVSASEGAEAADFPVGGCAEVRIVLRNGTEHGRRVDVPRGDPSRPLSWEDMAAKFRDCAALALPAERVEGALRLTEGLDGLDNVGRLTEALSG